MWREKELIFVRNLINLKMLFVKLDDWVLGLLLNLTLGSSNDFFTISAKNRLPDLCHELNSSFAFLRDDPPFHVSFTSSYEKEIFVYTPFCLDLRHYTTNKNSWGYESCFRGLFIRYPDCFCKFVIYFRILNTRIFTL